MLNSRHFRLFGAVIGGFWGAAAAMDYEPFPNCTEAAQVDSALEVVLTDESLDPDLAPYLGHTHSKYYPGTCYLKQQVRQYYYLSGETSTFEYTPRSTPRVYDVTWQRIPADRFDITGTVFYSALGEIDSALYRNILGSDSGTFDTSYSKFRHIAKPEYSLLQTFFGSAGGNWDFLWGDSIVTTANGKTVYSVDGGDTVVAQCGSVGPTYVCEEAPSSNGSDPRKSIWFLTQGRKDSLQTWENGQLIATEKYFWSARSAGIRSPRVRALGPAAASLWDGFDVLGRARSGSERASSAKTAPDRNKAWPHTRY
jgi:hypothetical protein